MHMKHALSSKTLSKVCIEIFLSHIWIIYSLDTSFIAAEAHAFDNMVNIVSEATIEEQIENEYI